jgi:phosphohistidine phosphatase
MKRLLVVRHAKSSWDDPRQSDHDRPLNKRGERDAPFMGKLIAESEDMPDLILTSTANRAQTTARYFAKAANLPEDRFRPMPELYPGIMSNILKVLNSLNDEQGHVWLFGHNPAMTQLPNYLCGSTVLAHMPTCGVVFVDLSIVHWAELQEGVGKQVEFHYPKQHFSPIV